jgi:hypothetical protein
LENCSNTRGCPLEQILISVLPNNPCPKDHQRIEPLSRLALNLDAGLAPPVLKGVLGWQRRELLKPHLLQQFKPYLSGNTHERSIWLIVSGCWSHRRQCSECSIPRLASLSAVQHLLCSTSHIKNLHLLGVQVFQTLFAGSNKATP